VDTKSERGEFRERERERERIRERGKKRGGSEREVGKKWEWRREVERRSIPNVFTRRLGNARTLAWRVISSHSLPLSMERATTA
jgi:hypothetical protein